MFITIDRFVLSQIEKCTQFLQKHAGIKVSTISSCTCYVMFTCVLARWYFSGLPTGVSLILDSFLVIWILLYIFLFSKTHQALVDTWAIQGVSNPYKIFKIYIFFRLVFCIYLGFDLLSLFRHNIDVQAIIRFTDTVGIWFYIYSVSVDALPPSSSKEGSWIKNLFKKSSLST